MLQDMKFFLVGLLAPMFVAILFVSGDRFPAGARVQFVRGAICGIVRDMAGAVLIGGALRLLFCILVAVAVFFAVRKEGLSPLQDEILMLVAMFGLFGPIMRGTVAFSASLSGGPEAVPPWLFPR
jgi:hypothetical protein